MRLGLWLIGAVGLFAATTARADPEPGLTVFAKSAATLGMVQQDTAACETEAKIRVAGSIPSYIQGGIPNPAVSLLSGILHGIQQERAERSYVKNCMRKRGYVSIPLSPREASELKAGSVDQQRETLQKFLIELPLERIEAASQPKVPPLPSLDMAEPFVVHGIRMVSSSLAGSVGAVGKDRPLITGQATYLARVSVSETFNLGGTVHARFEKGAVLYALDLPPTLEDDGPVQWWCGPITITTVFGSTPLRPGCIRSTFDGYQWFFLAEEWRPLLTESINPPQGGVRADGVLNIASIEDKSDAINIEFRISASTSHKIVLTLVSLSTPGVVPLWRGDVELNDQGDGTLPIWSKNAKIHRHEDGKVSVVIGDGDGAGL